MVLISNLVSKKASISDFRFSDDPNLFQCFEITTQGDYVFLGCERGPARFRRISQELLNFDFGSAPKIFLDTETNKFYATQVSVDGSLWSVINDDSFNQWGFVTGQFLI